ncbi:MAG TPA: class I fructose-bisphosphate aldolase [Dehalococcoidia bacterium]|nr:class I fructose-bisphosphate aldolase [Dehalococcoidia bacterium]
MNADLSEIANSLVARGKGILAADESSGTIAKRFDALGIQDTETNRRDYRHLLFTAEDAQEYISGVILFDETVRQNAADGLPLIRILQDRGIIPGIKVDKGTKFLAGSPDELVTEGLDGLRERLSEYYELGARFSKWRAVITIGEDMPSDYCIEVNAHALGRYAALSQEAGLVPIIEPEVLITGDHSIERCYEASVATLSEVFRQVARQRVSLRGLLLKASMVLSGSEAKNRASPEEVARYTVKCFEDCVPAAVPGIVFLSGGQSDEEATENLDAISRYAAGSGAPWELSFSYGRGLQAAPMKAWGGKEANAEAAQQAFLQRARMTAAAREGRYSASKETATA